MINQSSALSGTRIAQVKPEAGPAAGGTVITILGFELPQDDDMQIRLGHLPCNITLK